MSNKSTIVALALLVLLASCACLGAFASWTLNNAMGQAATIAEETTAHTEQTTVQICAGLFNVGSCRTRQSSTATAPRPAAADPGSQPVAVDPAVERGAAVGCGRGCDSPGSSGR